MTALGPFLGSFRGQENADGQPKAPGIRWFPRNPPRGEGINSLQIYSPGGLIDRASCPVGPAVPSHNDVAPRDGDSRGERLGCRLSIP